MKWLMIILTAMLAAAKLAGVVNWIWLRKALNNLILGVEY